MKISNYSYLCSKAILQMISNISNNKTIIDISDNYNEIFNTNESIDIKWMLISTSLLMSESLFKNKKTYNYISEKTIKEIEDKLFSFKTWFPGEEVKFPYLLDSTNKSALPFSDFLYYPEIDNDDLYDYEKLDDLDDLKDNGLYLTYYEDPHKNPYIKKYEEPYLIDGPYGCNDSIISNGLIDIKKLIIRVRNALAHSNYEIIDEDNVRLYHYNRKKKKLDFNIILDTGTIINILDELNEIAYKKYEDFLIIYYSKEYIDYTLIPKENMTDEAFLKFIMNFNICDKEIASIILERAKKHKLYKPSSYKGKALKKESNPVLDNVIKMQIIAETIYNYIKPHCDFGTIINDMMYSNSDGYINSDELYTKYSIYKYLKSDFYETNYKTNKDDIYKENQLKLLILSFLNCALLTSHNIFENKNIDFLNLDFSTMEIDKSILNTFILKHLQSNRNLIINLNEEVLKINNEIDKKNNVIINKKEIHSTKYVDNNYFNIILPKEIKQFELEVTELNKRKIELLSKIKEISENELKYNYDIDLSNFIFNALRNSLAHGYVNISKLNNDISETEIIFEDYNPSNKTELTFRGKIKLKDLLIILTQEENVIKLYNIENTSMNKSRKQ